MILAAEPASPTTSLTQIEWPFTVLEKKRECGGVKTRHQRRIDKLALSQMGHSTGHVQVHQFASRQQALKLSLMYELSLPVSFFGVQASRFCFGSHEIRSSLCLFLQQNRPRAVISTEHTL